MLSTEVLLRCSALSSAGNPEHKKDHRSEFCCAHLYLLAYRHIYRQGTPLGPPVRWARGSAPLLCALHPRPELEENLLPEWGVPREKVSAWELGNQHCLRCTRSAALKGRSQDTEEPGKGNQGHFQQEFFCFLVCFEFSPKNIVISCQFEFSPKSIVILMNQQVERKKPFSFFARLSRSHEPGLLSLCVSFNKSR